MKENPAFGTRAPSTLARILLARTNLINIICAAFLAVVAPAIDQLQAQSCAECLLESKTESRMRIKGGFAPFGTQPFPPQFYLKMDTTVEEDYLFGPDTCISCNIEETGYVDAIANYAFNLDQFKFGQALTPCPAGTTTPATKSFSGISYYRHDTEYLNNPPDPPYWSECNGTLDQDGLWHVTNDSSLGGPFESTPSFPQGFFAWPYDMPCRPGWEWCNWQNAQGTCPGCSDPSSLCLSGPLVTISSDGKI